MNVVNRIILALWSIVIAVLGFISIVCAMDSEFRIHILNSLEYAFSRSDYFWPVVIGSAVILGIGMATFLMAFQHKKISRPANIACGECGQVNISLEAIDTITRSAAKQIVGVADVRTNIKVVAGNIALYLHIMVEPEINIPEVTGRLQEEVKNKLESMAGIKIIEIKVLVNSITSATKN